MAGYSDLGARYLARLYGAGLTVSEMVSAKGLIYENKETEKLLDKTEIETPFAAQLFAHEPETLHRAVGLLPESIDIVDINMGCPAPKIVKNGEGSALLKDPVLAGELVAAAVSGSARPVTVKMRLGFEMGDFVADKVAKEVERAGASMVTVHGRYREQMYSGVVDKRAIRAVRDAVNIPLIANGDVRSVREYDIMMKETEADGVMIGRGALGNYRIFADILGKSVHRTEREDILLQIDYLKREYPERIVVNLMKHHVSAYASGKAGVAKEIRDRVHHATNYAELLAIVDEYFGGER
ncbi:MAG: tRNA-dihydrouridine synthase family protein [Clostridia bacterium]|nr:tRNA-dihydrouridine synthase family protein [Clostridia bacterium]